MSDAAQAAPAADAVKGKVAAAVPGLEQVLAQLRGNPMVLLMVAGAAVVAIIFALLMWAGSPEYRVLYSNLSDADGGRIVNELESRGVPYRFSQGGQALLVPSNQVHGLRLQMAEQGLPQGGNVGFELMDTQAFGISQFAEQINYQRSLEGELSRSMESLGPVSRARVHLALAKQSVFVRDREPAKASVILTLHPGRALGEGQVSAIVHMVSSSVSELSADNVTVVDQNGRLLSAQTAGGNDLDGTQLSYIDEVERGYQRRIENILIPILGRQNVRAQVAAHIDFSRREETSERFEPNQAPNLAAIRSHQGSLALNGDEALAQGIPGALSNTPPGFAPAPINANENGDGDAAQNGARANGNLRQDSVTNYELDRSITHIQHRLGQVQRLTAAVVVNFRDDIDDEGNPVRVPLTEIEIEQIERLVRQAMGFTAERGDQIEVVNSPFSTVPGEDEQVIVWWQQPEMQSLILTISRYLLVLLAALLLYWLLLRPLIKRHVQPAAAKAATGATLNVQVGDDDDDDYESVREPATEGEAIVEAAILKRKPKRRGKAATYQDNLNDLRDMAEEDPRMVAMILRNWMSKND